MQKFFNLHENPFTQNLNLFDDNIVSVTEKLDGSLISTVRNGSDFQVKSKTSFESGQVVLANKIIDEDQDLQFGLYQATNDGYTVNMELIGPGNPNVLLYPKNELRILNVRNIQTGEYISPLVYFQEHRVVKSLPCKKSFLDSVPGMKGIEGFVVTLRSGEIFKIKTEEYVRF